MEGHLRFSKKQTSFTSLARPIRTHVEPRSPTQSPGLGQLLHKDVMAFKRCSFFQLHFLEQLRHNYVAFSIEHVMLCSRPLVNVCPSG